MREIPGDMPPELWWEKVCEYRDDPDNANWPWYNSVMEFLRPLELATLRAKARVWWEVTGEYVTDISCWWEVRSARKRGDLPLSTEVAVALYDTEVLTCGKCQAPWSVNKDGSEWPDYCSLCGVRWNKVKVQEAEWQPN